MDWTPIWLTLQLAAITTLILLIIGTPIAWWLARTRFVGKSVIESIVALPLVLPPTVLGFYLLILMGSQGWLGQLWLDWFGSPLVFSFTGLVVASVIYSFPFVVQPLKNAFEALGHLPLEAAATLRATPLDRFFTVIIPLTKHGFISAITLGFAHTLGEFGVVLMVGGNIPGKTQVLSIAIYDSVEALDYAQAHWLSAGLLGFSFLLLWMLNLLQGRWATKS